MVLDSFFNATLGPLLGLPNPWGLLILCAILSIFMTVVYKYATDQELMKTLKEDMKAMQKEMKSLKNDPKKMMEVQKKTMEKNMKYMMQSFKPMLITFIPFILIFPWLRTYYIDYGPVLSIFGLNLNWFWTYFLFTMVLSIALRKILKVH
ncbi:MAG: EMC3/TMCO1 family protein [archaeon]